MSFDGPALSFDDEGSILFDGEKIIVTVPVGHEALDHLGTEEGIPFPVVYTHPSHHQDPQASTHVPPPGGNPVFNKDKVREHVERARQARESARDKESKSGKSDVKDDSPADRAPVTDKRDLASDAIDEEPAAEAVWQDYTLLTPGQQMHVDNLLSIETDSLAREVLITLKREGLPPNDQWREFLEQYALTGWYAASDAIAWATLAKIANSDWDKTFAYADDEYVETAAQDLGDNAIEGLVVIDAETGDTLFDRPGVVRADGSQYVGMQDTEAEALLAEALSGRDLIFVHNHTEEIGASDEDLDSAFAAGAKLLVVITQQGQEYVYIRGRYGMVEVRDEKASYVVGPENSEETEKLRIRSEAQAWAFQHDSPEHIFRQDKSGIQIEVTGQVQFAESETAVVKDEEGTYDEDSYEESLFNVVGKSRFNPYVILVEDEKEQQFWIDLKEYDNTTYEIIGVENLANVPIAKQSAPAVANPFENLVRQTVDFLPIAVDEITRVLEFGAANCDNYDSLPECAHPGIDYFAPAGTDVRAVTSGEIIAVYVPAENDYSDVYGDGRKSEVNEGSIYDPRDPEADTRKIFAEGWLTEHSDRAYVIVRSGNAYFLYAHLDPKSIQVGTHVVEGQTIGTVGVDPHQDNDHLHFEVRTHGGFLPDLDDTGEYVDPFDRPQIGINPLWLHSEGAVDDLEYRYREDMKPFEDQFQAMEMFRGEDGKIWRPEGFWITVVWPGEDVADESAGQ